METETPTTPADGTTDQVVLTRSTFAGRYRLDVPGHSRIYLDRAQLQQLLDQALDNADMTAQPFRTVQVPR